MLPRSAALAAALCVCVAAHAAAIFPIDRATMLAGAKFDLKVEFDKAVSEAEVQVTINGVDARAMLGKMPRFIANDEGSGGSAVLARDVTIAGPGRYEVVARTPSEEMRVTWEVYAAGPRKAKNVILFVGDGMTIANRTAARILSRGIHEGKYRGVLAFDDMPRMALVGTSGVDSIITDSANSMSAYTTGHKSSVNALGVYVARNKDNLAHPKVETLTELVKRSTKMSVGIVTDAEVQDATPAGMFAHTRRRADKDIITEQLFFSGADVVMGGGSAYFLPQTTPGSKRKDQNDFVELFRRTGYRLATTDSEMKAAAGEAGTTKLLGLFHPENLDGALDRRFLGKGTVDRYPEQPDLADMTRAALAVLSRNKEGFVLMVEAALIDKYNHPLDWERSVYDTIMLSNAVQVARDFAGRRNDTLIIVTPDHTHGLSIVGTIDDEAKAADMRDRIGIYSEARYPNYPPADASGYPARVDVSRRLALFYAAFPDHYETYRPHVEGPFVPAVKAEKGFAANPAYKDAPGAVLREGNLPRAAEQGVHSADDALLTAMGPGSEQFHGFVDNTQVFRAIVTSLGLKPPAR